MTSPILTRVQQLAALRRAAAKANADLAEAQAQFRLDKAPMIQRAMDANAAVAAEETALRAVAIEIYETRGTTAIAPGLAIKLFTKFSYAAEQALAFCRNAKIGLVPETFDVKIFEKIAKASPLDFVTYEHEPRVTIATDLDKALAASPTASPSVSPADAPQVPQHADAFDEVLG